MENDNSNKINDLRYLINNNRRIIKKILEIIIESSLNSKENISNLLNELTELDNTTFEDTDEELEYK